MAHTLAVVLGLAMTLVAVVLHYAKGTGWQATEDITQEVLERRAASVPETDFPEPYNRGIGGGAPAGAIGAGESEGELAEGEAEEEGFDPDSISEDEVEYYEIEFAKQGETIEVANNENLLEAGEDEGYDMPYACRQGQCLSCAAHIDGGPAEEFIRHSNNETLSEEEMENGYCLTCVAYPTTGFTIETGEQP
ncbi:MAG: 2Fe-2S iron-sulfur cluster-binding protein [Halapricum sp.]